MPLIDAADLVVAKILAGRPKDLDDARTIWQLHRQKLDVARIRRTLASLEQALSQSDLVPAFEALSAGMTGVRRSLAW